MSANQQEYADATWKRHAAFIEGMTPSEMASALYYISGYRPKAVDQVIQLTQVARERRAAAAEVDVDELEDQAVEAAPDAVGGQ